MSVRDSNPRAPRRHHPRLHEALIAGCQVQRNDGSVWTVSGIDRHRQQVILVAGDCGRRASFGSIDLDYRLVAEEVTA